MHGPGIPSVLATRPFPAFAASDSRLRINAGPAFRFGVFADRDLPVHGQAQPGACLTAPRSIRLTEAGLREAEAAFRRLFDPEDEAAG